jgi:hypothetical protein
MVQNGYAVCYFNREPEFTEALQYVGAAPVSPRKYQLTAEQLTNVARLYQLDDFVVPFDDRNYSATKTQKDKPVIKTKKKADDESPGHGWVDDDRNKWVIVFDVNDPERLRAKYIGDTVRAVVAGRGIHYYSWNAGDSKWHYMSRTNVSDQCASLGMSDGETKAFICMLNRTPWKCESYPFRPEYPGGRVWNRQRATFAYKTSKSASNYYPMYERILTHVGKNLDGPVSKCPECQRMGIKTGRDWLFCWLAIMVQRPEQKTHYLYLWSPEAATGKTTFYEVISKLFKDGVQYGDKAMTGEYNSELEGKVLVIIEEMDLGKNKTAYEMMKRLTATEDFLVHPKFDTPYTSVNYLHFLHCTNYLDFAPVREGDMRCVILRVGRLADHEYIDRKVLLERLDEESPDFLSALLNFQLPPQYKRFWLPLPETADRIQLLNAKENPSSKFISEALHSVPGDTIPFSDVYTKYQEWCIEEQRPISTKQQFHLDILRTYPVGRIKKNRDLVGNASFERKDPVGPELILDEGFLK